MGEGIKRYKFPIIKLVSYRDVMYSMVTIVNKTFVYLYVARRVDLECFHCKKNIFFGNYVW